MVNGMTDQDSFLRKLPARFAVHRLCCCSHLIHVCGRHADGGRTNCNSLSQQAVCSMMLMFYKPFTS